MKPAKTATLICSCVLGLALGSCQQEEDPMLGLPGHPCAGGLCIVGAVCVNGICFYGGGDEETSGDGDDQGDGDGDSGGDGDGDGDDGGDGDGDDGGDGDGDDGGDGDGDDGGDGDGDDGGDGDGDGDVSVVVDATLVWTSNTGHIPASLDFSPDDTLLASGGWDGFSGDFTIRSAQDGAVLVGPLDTNLDNYAVSWSPSGDRVASLWAGNTDYALFSPDGDSLGTATGCAGGNSTAMEWHPNVDEILLGTDQLDYLCLKNANTGATMESWAIDGYRHGDVVWSNSGARFASYVNEIPDGWFQPHCIIHVFDRQNLAEINVITLEPDYCDDATDLAWRPGTQEIYAAGHLDDAGIVARVNSTGNVMDYWGADAEALAFSPDGTKLAVIKDEGYVWIVDPVTWDIQHEFWAHTGLTLSIAWSHDGQLLATGGETPRLRVWELQYSN